MRNVCARRGVRLLWLAPALLTMLGTARAQDADPPTRAGRLAYLEGSVSFQPAGSQEWVVAPLNRPLTTGDTLWSDSGSRAELQLDDSVVRLADDTSFALLDLADNVTQIQLSAGTLIVRVWGLPQNRSYEIDTPNLAFSVLSPGEYRVFVDPSGASTAIF
ncbi:MAG TPA: FecR domain-containing protein, partial [Steroidobacteraceae bacterium]|nr:FecR domain-containing protein [Steroidobacteraceae bacterium]